MMSKLATEIMKIVSATRYYGKAGYRSEDSGRCNGMALRKVIDNKSKL